jgi:general secretion pathway protein K
MRRQSGIALIAVLWLTVLLTVIASSFAFSMRNEVLAARNAISSAQARAAADGAVERTIFELQRPRNLPDAWSADGQPQAWQEGEAAITVVAVDESAKIDLNAAPDVLLKGLLQTVGGLHPDAAGRLLDAINDWKDADEQRRPNGAEAPEYLAAGREYRPADGPFAVVGELQRVLGMSNELHGRIADSLTVLSRQPGINFATASRSVLLAVPGATPEIVDGYLQLRAAAIAAKTPIPPFPAAGATAGAAIAVWRVRAQATMPDGVTFVREAVARASPHAGRPEIMLLWQEGTVVTPADASAESAAPGPPANNDGTGTR